MLRFILPPGWVPVPLQPAERRDAALRRVVEGTPWGDGEGARLKRDARAQLQGAAEQAAASGATGFFLAGGDALIPGSLVVTPVPGPLVPAGEEGWLTETEAASTEPEISRAEVSVGRVVRRVRVLENATAQSDLPRLVVDYWVRPQVGEGAHLVFSTPVVVRRELTVGLFDAIVEAARWVAPEGSLGGDWRGPRAPR